MKIKFLGTSSGWPSPRIGCPCSQCHSTDPKDKRWRSSLLVDDVLIDAGPDAYHQFMRYNLTKIKALVITHAHPDHILGLHDIDPRKIYHLKTAPLYGVEQTWKFVHKFFPESSFEEKIIQPEQKFEIGDLKFETFPVTHCLTYNTLALLINKRVVYIPDVRKFEKKYEKLLENLDLAILDGSCLDTPFPPWTNSWGHWTMKEACELTKKLKIKRVIFTHIGHKTKPYQELNEILKKCYDKAEAAYDGMEVEI